MASILHSILLIAIVVMPPLAVSQDLIRDHDTMGDVNCEAEMARLDHLAVELEKIPSAKAVIIFYGGIRFRGRLPKRGEAAARAARLKPYLVKRRGISADRVIVIDGGYRADWEVEFWIIPPGEAMPEPQSVFEPANIKFRKGKAHPRDFRCKI